MLKRFRLEEPQSIAEVAELLGRFGDSAKIYAGGTELLLAMKEGLVDYERLVNIKKVKGLNDISTINGTIKIGALCTHYQLENSSALKEKLPSLVKLEQNVANVRVRHAGTIGGNLCFAEPHADPGTLLIALGATMTAAKGSSSREIPAADFFVDAYETSLAAEEVLTELRIPAPAPDARSVYLKFGYLERPSVGVALALNLNGGAVRNVRVAVGCAGPAPKRVEDAEALLEGKGVDEALGHLAQAGTIAGRASQAISDLHGSQEYKEHIVGVLLKRAFHSAVS
ncbi:MAG TPA: xanthine dehydrogenase family protein subunit M [Verrucomicrobiae bacterium]|nr:xanthine dehydrogenase family protein subunit M [Verrucomicrobiae bacterium]